MSNLTKEDKTSLKEVAPKGFVCRMFCTNCKSVHLIDKSAMLLIVFALDDVKGINREGEINWEDHYIETSFCENCDSKKEHVAIKKIV
jgi:hypothetical protein